MSSLGVVQAKTIDTPWFVLQPKCSGPLRLHATDMDIGIQTGAMEAGDPDWRDRVEGWLAEVQEAYRIGFQNLYQEWLEWRDKLFRKGPCTKGTIEILCNNPFGPEWSVITLDCTDPYHPEILFEEVRSWLKKEFGRELDEGGLRYWHA
jgi:hypothetical protein